MLQCVSQSHLYNADFRSDSATKRDTARSTSGRCVTFASALAIFVEPPSTSRRASPKLLGISAAWAFLSWVEIDLPTRRAATPQASSPYSTYMKEEFSCY